MSVTAVTVATVGAKALSSEELLRAESSIVRKNKLWYYFCA